jgi:hypothetical protein
MNQTISNAYRIAAAESAINDHRLSLHGRDCDELTQHCSAAEAHELLASLALWAEVNNVTLRIPRPVYTEEVDA